MSEDGLDDVLESGARTFDSVVVHSSREPAPSAAEEQEHAQSIPSEQAINKKDADIPSVDSSPALAPTRLPETSIVMNDHTTITAANSQLLGSPVPSLDKNVMSPEMPNRSFSGEHFLILQTFKFRCCAS
jgi:hypothetical protein